VSDRDRIRALIGDERMHALFRGALSGYVTKRPPRWIRAWANMIGDGTGADLKDQHAVAEVRA